jgi:NADH-quinone oxidoreductase subunit L
VLSVVGGYVGMPGWTGVPNVFEHFLEPVLRLPETGGHEGAAHHSSSVEMLFTALSVGIGLLGIYLAYHFYVKSPGSADRVAARFSGLHETLRRKYYVDELYDALFVNRTKDLGNACFLVDSRFVDGAVNGTAHTTKGTAWVSGKFDTYVVDGLVNLVGWINMMLNRVATATQTGMVQRYALGAVFGIVVFVLIYFNHAFQP